jgi:hypothetical protein
MKLNIENTDRGEVKLIICKENYLLSLNFAAISKIQRHFGESIMIICSKCWAGSQTPEQLASIVLLASGKDKDIEVEDMVNAIMLEGLVEVSKAINSFLAMAINGGRAESLKAGKSKRGK